MGIGYQELLIILALALLLFGGTRIPTLARSLGKSITEFKKGVKGIEDDPPETELKETKSGTKTSRQEHLQKAQQLRVALTAWLQPHVSCLK